MGPLIPGRDEGHERRAPRRDRGEIAVPQALSMNEAKEQLDLIDPGRVLRRGTRSDARGGR